VISETPSMHGPNRGTAAARDVARDWAGVVAALGDDNEAV